LIPFVPKFLHRLHRSYLGYRSNRRAFTAIYRQQLWSSGESVSGDGSTLLASASLREVLPSLLAGLEARSLLDAGCGDFNWMKTVKLYGVRYIGIDVVADLIAENVRRYASGDRSFIAADITKDRLPHADVVLCRHCFIHLPNDRVIKALNNMKVSGASYLLATTFPAINENADIWPGSFRPINLRAAPFHLPEPMRNVRDSATAGLAVLGLWSFNDINLQRLIRA
jgi:SAM-dependent methyltransferase